MERFTPELVSVYEHTDFKSFLRALYEEHKQKKKGFSWKDFANFLDIDSDQMLRQMVQGHRTITEKTAKKIARRIAKNKAETAYLISLHQQEFATTVSQKQENLNLSKELRSRKKASSPLDDVLSDWLILTVFEILGDTSKVWTLESLKDVLRIPVKKVRLRKAVNSLLEANLIKENRDHSIVRVQEEIAADSVSGSTVIGYHLSMMELAKLSLFEISPDLRDLSSTTVRINQKEFDRLKGLLDVLRNYLMYLSNTSNKCDKTKTMVAQINVQLFSLTKEE